jgi:hypothetical protein
VSGARWLFIVRRDHPRLHAYLRDAFAGVEQVEVILDRRQADRPISAERRSPELTKAEQELWDEAGFRLVYRDPEFGIYRADTTVPPPPPPPPLPGLDR